MNKPAAEPVDLDAIRERQRERVEAAALDNYCPRCRIISHQRTHVVAYCACGDEAWVDCCADQECSHCGLPFQAPVPAALTAEKLDAFSELEKRATPGPWHTAKRRVALIIAVDRARVADCHVAIGADAAESQRNAEFIAAVRSIAPRLVAQVKEQAELITELQRELSFYFGAYHSTSGHRSDSISCMENECVRVRNLALAKVEGKRK